MTEERERLRQLNALRIDVELDGLIDAARRVHGAALDKASLHKACIEAPRAARPSTWAELQRALGDNALAAGPKASTSHIGGLIADDIVTEANVPEPLNRPEDIFAEDEFF